MVTEDDLIAALFSLEPTDANPHGARTMGELVAASGMCRDTVLTRLHALKDAGQLGVTKLRKTTIDDRPWPTAAYYLRR